MFFFFFFSSRRRHTRSLCDWSSDVCSSDLAFQEPASLVGQQHASASAPEKSRSQMLFQTLDALAHRAVGDVHLLCGVREIQVTGSRFEEAKRLERRKYARHSEMIASLTADVRNDRWQIVASAAHHP